MMEDKLEHDERLRLECLAQAIAASHSPSRKPNQTLIERAAEFEQYVRGGEK